MTGNIIAFKGFVQQYGECANASGATILCADHLGMSSDVHKLISAAWGGIQSAGQGFAMLSQHFVADRFGRKASFYLLWCTLLIAVFLQAFGTNWKIWLVAKCE